MNEQRDFVAFLLPAGERLDSKKVVDLGLSSLGQPMRPVAVNAKKLVLGSVPLNYPASALVVVDASDPSRIREVALLSEKGAAYVPIALNEEGWVVGAVQRNGGRRLAFLMVDGTVTYLNDYLPEGSKFTNLGEPTDINDRGDIVGTGTVQGRPRAFMLRRR